MLQDTVSLTALLAGGIASNFILRTVVFSTLKWFGAFDPRWDEKWPRLPWRVFWRGWLFFTEWREENFSGGTPNAGKAGWITQLALSPYKEGHSLIGRVRLPFGIPNYSMIGEPSERHKVFIGSARSNKSVQLKTELALLPDNACALVTDPKGEITEEILIPLEEAGHELCVLDVMNCTSRKSQSINFHRQVDLINERLGEDRTTMILDRMASIFFPPSKNEKQFFTDMGREGWARIDCFAKLTIRNSSQLDTRRLVQVGFIEKAGGDEKLAMAMLWKAMIRCDAYDGYVSSWGAQMLEIDERTRSNVLATIRSKTAFLDHPQVKAVSRGNDVNLCDLKNPDSGLIVSIPAPVGDMKTTLRPWIGSIVSLSLAVMEWIPGDLKPKTRFVLEEAQAIGEQALPGLGDTAALMAGMGVQLTVVVQGMTGFAKAFPQDYKSIIGNAQHVVFMASNEPETYEYIANKAFGERTVRRKKWRLPFLWTVASWHEPVITPDKARRYLESSRNNAIVMRNGKRSMFVKAAKSFQTLPVWMIRPSAVHGETPARAWFRHLYETHLKALSGSSENRNSPAPVPFPSHTMTRSDALALFGLSEPFSRNEIAARAAMLRATFPPELINTARRILEGV